MPADQGNVNIAHEEFTLTLDKVIDGERPSYLPLKCKFQYFWDYPKNTGLAHLMTMNNGKANQLMLPLDPPELDFKTHDNFRVILGDVTFVDVIAVQLNMAGHGIKSAAAILGNAADNCAVATSDWDVEKYKPMLDFDVVDEPPLDR